MTPTTKKRNRRERSSAEWVTFAVSTLILAVVVGLIALQAVAGHEPAVPVATQDGEVREEDGRFYVPVSVENKGDATAENVQVTASLKIGEETAEADQTIDFLSGGESEGLEFVFDEDPGGGELEVEVTGYLVP